MVSVIDTIYDDVLTIPTEDRRGVQALVAVIMKFVSDSVDEYDEMVSTLYGRSYYYLAPIKLDLDLKNRASLPDRSSIVELLVL